jgi:biopolymer transport protein ExbD
VEEGRLKVELPSASEEPVTTIQDPIVITITAQGSYRVNEQPLVNNSRETLMAAVRKVADGRRDAPVTIRADGRATHQVVVTAMDVAARLGFTQVNIATVSEQT